MPGTRPYSPSKLDAYSICPHRYFLIHEQKKERVSNEIYVRLMQMGTAVHAFIERYVEACRETRVVQDLAAAQSIAEAMWATRPSGCLNEDDFTEYFSLCARWASQFLVPTTGVVRTELPIGLAAADGGGFELCESWMDPSVDLRLKPDYVHVENNHATVLDWSTGWSGTKPRIQREAYAFAIWCWQPHIEGVTVRFVYLRLKDDAGRMLEEKEVFTREQLLRLAEKTRRQMRRIDEDADFTPRPTLEHCMTCPVAYACSARPRELERIATKSEAEDAAAQLALLEAHRARLMIALKSYAADHGAVRSGDVVVDVDARQRTELDSDAQQIAGRYVFDEALALVGMSARPYLKIDMAKVEADGLLDHRLVGSILRDLTTEKIERRFRRRKVKTKTV
jgi:hypothetical protein